MRTGFLITARLKSTRLPKKLTLEVVGENYITWMVRRLKLATDLDQIVICTSTNPQDDPLEEVARKEGIACFRGSEEDVASRLYEASQKYKLDYFINMTADCPFVPFDYISSLIELYKETDADLIKCYDLPEGMFLSGVKPSAMKRVIDLKDTGFMEYWLFVFLKTDLFNVIPLPVNEKLIRRNYRFVLDYPEDHDFLKALYETIGESAYLMGSEELILWLDEHQELSKINADCSAKGLKRTLEDQTSKVKLKDGTIVD